MKIIIEQSRKLTINIVVILAGIVMLVVGWLIYTDSEMGRTLEVVKYEFM